MNLSRIPMESNLFSISPQQGQNINMSPVIDGKEWTNVCDLAFFLYHCGSPFRPWLGCLLVIRTIRLSMYHRSAQHTNHCASSQIRTNFSQQTTSRPATNIKPHAPHAWESIECANAHSTHAFAPSHKGANDNYTTLEPFQSERFNARGHLILPPTKLNRNPLIEEARCDCQLQLVLANVCY